MYRSFSCVLRRGISLHAIDVPDGEIRYVIQMLGEAAVLPESREGRKRIFSVAEKVSGRRSCRLIVSGCDVSDTQWSEAIIAARTLAVQVRDLDAHRMIPPSVMKMNQEVTGLIERGDALTAFKVACEADTEANREFVHPEPWRLFRMDQRFSSDAGKDDRIRQIMWRLYGDDPLPAGRKRDIYLAALHRMDGGAGQQASRSSRR